MPKTNRRDRPGARHHVMNRGIAKRTCFPDLAAKRRFLGLLACAARRGDLIIEAYSILDTHFHLMVRSTEVGLSKAMMRVLNAYVRYFNRRFRRDGSLFRGRFRSILVDSIEYAIRLLRYIDRNPVVARMCDHPVQYPAGSARFYARSSRRPLWLERAAVERWITSIHRRRLFEPSDYARWSGSARGDGSRALVEERLRCGNRGDDPLDELARQPAGQVAAWMRRKAALADGTAPWTPITTAADLDAALDEARQQRGEYTLQPGRKRVDAWAILQAGLLSTAAGLRGLDIARHTGRAAGTVSRRVRLHRDALREDETYASIAGRILRAALDRTLADD